MAAHVFGYGSLVAGARHLAVLRGHRRVWGVAMDNRVAVPGYKVYEEPGGSRPAVDVAFLDLEEDATATAVNGALVPVDHAALTILDRRERQYHRVDVAAHVDPAPAGPVWAYVGRVEGRSRVARGRRRGSVVVQRAYHDLVDRCFASLGPQQHAAYRETTEPVPFPLADLVRVDLAGGEAVEPAGSRAGPPAGR
jgi:hypothetical protein